MNSLNLEQERKMVKEKINRLIKECKDDADMLDIIQSDVLALGEYVTEVCSMEFSSILIREREEGEKLREDLEKCDQERHNAHERAIMGVKRLNRFAAMKGLSPIYEGDINNRYEIADFCSEVMNEYFDTRTL